MTQPTDILTYNQLTSEQRVYMFEFILAAAVQSALQALNIISYTAFVSPELQKHRPRVEVFFTPGAGQKRFIKVNGVPRETSWKGQYRLDCITAADNLIHGAYVVAVRAKMHGIADAVNETQPMALHKVQPFFHDAGTSPVTKPEEGSFSSTLLFSIDFSIQANAWALLTNEP
jgi:hypothetical protein